jgi:hypothetical protein
MQHGLNRIGVALITLSVLASKKYVVTAWELDAKLQYNESNIGLHHASPLKACYTCCPRTSEGFIGLKI